jgi:broad specificity phosphatase PhoE
MAVRRIEANHPSAHIIAVAHFGVILTQVQAVLGLGSYEVLAHKIDPLSVTTLRPDEKRAEVINHNP